MQVIMCQFYHEFTFRDQIRDGERLPTFTGPK